MRKDTMNLTISEAKRFLRAATKLETENDLLTRDDPETARYKHFDITLAKYTAAVKRSSMDLSRALSNLRQGK